MPLEPRIMYDGAGAASAAVAHHHADHHADNHEAPAASQSVGGGINATPRAPATNGDWHQHGSGEQSKTGNIATDGATSQPGNGMAPVVPSLTSQPTTQVVFVDSQITDYQAIVAAINPGVKAIVYDGTQDGLAEIAKDLQGVHGLASIDIISPGGSDAVQIGTDTLTTSTISTYAGDLTAVGKALSPHGQLDLYGGDVTGAGDGFLTALQQATGRNVAASTSPVGATTLGGTWTLDATTGPTPDALPANATELQSFDGLLTNPAGLGPGDQVVFVDSQIVDYQAIVAAINPGVTVIVYDGTQDGLAQIAQDLQGAYDLASVDIISHGAVDQVQIGTDRLSTSTIPNYAADLTAIGNALAPTGQLDLYGCDVAAAGDGFLTALQQATGRNVAASTDPIGATALGGTWTLDASTGPTPDALPANFMAIQSFDGVLLSPVAEIYGANGSATVSAGYYYSADEGAATDSAGDIFITGTFDGSVYFGTKSGNSSPTELTSSSGTAGDVFVAKYNSSGVLQWVDDFGSSSNNGGYPDNGVSIAVTPNGTDVYAGGNFYGTFNFGNGLSASIGSGYTGAFVVQLSGSTGAAQWDITAHGSSTASDAEQATVATDSSGNVYVALSYNQSSANLITIYSVGGASNVSLSPTTGGNFGSAIFEASSSGAIDWHATMVDTQGADALINTIAVDSSDNVYVGGMLYDAKFTSANGSSATVGTPTFSETFNGKQYTVADYGGFIAELNSSGNFQWENAAATTTISASSSADPLVTGIAIDQYGPVITGYYYDGTTIDGQLLHTHTWTNSGSTYASQRVFVEQFNTSGTPQWYVAESDNGQQGTGVGSAITVDASGDIVVGGLIASPSATADTFGGKSLTPPATYTSEAFVWTITPGSSSGTTASLTGFTSSNSETVGGLFDTVGGGATAAVNISGTASVEGTSVGTSGIQSIVLVGLTPSQLGEVAPSPTITSATYNASNGDLTVTGSNFTTSAANYSATALTLTGQDGDTYTLTGGSTIAANPTSTSFTVDLSGADQLAVDGLLNKNGTSSVGGTTYNLAATASFDTGGAADTTSAITVSNALAPSINAVSFDYATGVLTLAGTGFENEGSTGGLRLGDFTLKGQGGSTFTLTTAAAAVASEISATITLTGAELTSVKALFDKNGASSTGGTTYNLAATAGWDSDAGAAITTEGITVSGVPAPTIGGTGNTVDFYQNGSAVAVDGAITVTDPAGNSITSAAVTISSGFLSGDTLNFTNQSGITGSYDSSTGVLSLSGAASASAYQTALESVTYSFSGDPTNAGADKSRTVAWSVTDTNGQTQNNSTLDVYALPIVSTGSATTPTETSTSGAVVADSTLSITDYNGTTIHSASVQITSGDVSTDTLTINGTTSGTITGITYSFTGATLTLTGTASVANYAAALDDVKFDAVSPNSGPRVLTWEVNDQAGGNTNNSAPVTTNVNVTFGPQVVAGATATFNGGGSPVALDAGLTVTDPSSTTLASATVSITTGFLPGDTLNFTTQNGIAGSYDAVHGILSLSGTASLANYQTALDSITYSISPANADPTGGGGDTSRTISWTVNDGTTSNTPAATSTLDTVHTAPMVVTAGTATFTGGGSAVVLDSGVELSDVDSNGTLASATVSIASGYITGDTLNFTNTNPTIEGNISISSDAGGVLVLTSSGDTATVAQWQTALSAVTYSFSPSNGDPTAGGGDTSRTIDWVVKDGSTSNGTSNTGTSTLDTVHVAPTVTTGGTVTFDGGGSPVTLDGTATVSDVDSAGNLNGATVKISSGLLSGDTLDFTNQNGISGSYDSATGTLTLTGTSSLAHYQTALDSITYSFTPSNGDPTSNGSDTTRTISWTVTDGSTSHGTSNTSTSALDTVHVAPIVTAGGTVTFDGGGAPVTLDGTLTVSDPDSGGNLTGATVTLSSGLLSGDTLDFTNQNGITGSYDSTTGTLTLTGTSSVAHYQTALDSITYSFSPSNGDPTSGGSDTARTISWTVTDGSTSNGTSNTSTSALDTVHVAPTVTAGGTATFDGGGSPVTLDGTLTVSDPDSAGNLTGATVTISSGLLSGDALNFTNQNGISGSYDGTTGVLTLTGTTSVANYQTALDSITYSFSPSNGDPTGGGGDTARTISWTVTDGSTSNGTSSTATSTLDVVHVAPTVTAGGTATFDGGGSPVTLDGTLSVSDVDSAGNLTGATVSISTGLLSGDALNFTNQNGITGSYDSTTGLLTLTGTTSVANYQTALDSITYSFSPSNGDPTNGGIDTTRTVSWTVTDGSTSNGTSANATSTLDTVHVAPTVTAGATATFEVSGPAVTADNTLTVSDIDSAGNLTAATVKISTGFVSGDALNFTNQNGITGNYDAAAGMLNLIGTTSVANYQTALDSITFSSTVATAGTRTLTWNVDDGSTTHGISANETSTVDVVVGPQITAGATVTFDGGGSPVTLDGTLTVTDVVHSTLDSATVSITTGFLSGDELNFTNQNGITGSYDGTTGVLTLTGTTTLANYQTALDSITYSFTPSNGDPTNGGVDASRTVSWSANDGTATSTAVTSTVDTVHVAPTVTAGGTATFTGGGAAVTLDSTLTLNDVDSGGNLTGATVKISSGLLSGDTLSFTNQNGISGAYDSATGVLSLSGTASVANYQTALDSIAYSFSPSNGDPTGGGGDTARTISWTVSDGSTSNGTGSSTSTLDTVHVAPTVTSGGTVTFTGGGGAVDLDSTLTVSDTDSSGHLSGATVSISSGFISGDTLNFTNQNGITGSYNAVSGTLTLTGTASIADYQAALESVTYNFNPTNGDPTNGGGDTSRTISWVANDGNTISGISNTGTSTLDTVHVAPTVTSGGTVTFTGGGGPVTLDSGLTVSDVDNSGNLNGATVSISAGLLNGDTLNFTNQATITGSYDAATGTLTLSGTASLANYQTALESISYSFSPSNGDPTNGETDTSRTISWSVTDGSTSNGTSNTSTSTLDTTHTPPTVIAGASATFDGGGSPVTLDGTVTVTDPDSNGNLSSAFVTINSGFVSGDTLNFTNQNGITGSYDAVHGQLSLSGTASLADYQTALESVTYSFSPANGDPTHGGGATSRIIAWTADDGESSATGQSMLTVVHVAPTVTAGGSATFDGGSSPVTLDGTLALTDVDSGGNLTGATVKISAGLLSGDTLDFTNQNGITGSYDSTTGLLTLTGTSSVANYQTALDSITYSFSPGNGDPTAGGDTARTISWTVTDGSTSNGTSNTGTSALDTVHVAPTVTAGATATFETNGPAVTADGALTVSDVDSGGNLNEATVSISSNFQTGDALNFTNQNGITGSYDAVHGILTLTGTASVANYQTALDSITFSSTVSTAGIRTLSWTVSDGATSNSASNTATSTIDLVVGPQLTAGATATFDGGGSPVTLDGALTVSDPASTTLDGASVSISANFLSGDQLNFTNQNGITGSYDAVHGVLTLTGTSSVANYQTALDSITYSFSPSNGDPTGGGGDTSRTITWAASDLYATSIAVTSTLDTVHVAPVVTAGGTATFDGGGSPVALDGTATVSDVDSAGNLTGATVSISSNFLSGDELNFTNQNGITGSYDAVHGTLTLTGTSSVANYQTALDSITYSFNPANGDPTGGGGDTSRTVSYTVTDGSTSNGTSNTATSTIDTVHVAPTVTAGGTATFDGGGSAVTLDGALTVSDVDSSGQLTGASVSISSNFLSGDVLDFTNQNGITGSYDAVHGTLTLTGTSSVANYQTALDSITYSFNPTNGDPTGGGGDTARTISWTVTDGNTSHGTSNTATSTLDTVHVAPTVTAGGTATFDGGGSPVTLDGTVSVSDVDSSGQLGGATVSISSNFLSGDTLNFTNQAGISGSYDAVHGILTLTGTSSLASYQIALDSITYSFSPANGDPTNGGGDTSRTVSWTVTDGSTSNGTSVAKTSTLDVVHEPPTVTAGTTVTLAQNSSSTQAAIALDTTLTLADPDSNGVLTGATVSISSGFLDNALNSDVLNFTNQNGITGHYDAVHGILTLTGTSSVANYQTALESITFNSIGPNPTNDGANLTRTISYTVTDGNTHNGTSVTATSTVNVQAFPTVVAGGTVDFQAGLFSLPVQVDPNIGVYDGTNLTGATVSIANGFVPGDILLASTGGTSIHESYNPATGVLTLTGNDTVAHYDHVLQSVSFFSLQTNNGTADISTQVTDTNGKTSLAGTSHVKVTGLFGPPITPPPIFSPPPYQPPHSGSGDFFGVSLNFPGDNGLALFGGGQSVIPLHADINVTVADNGAVDFNVPLGLLEASLDGDVVSITATLPDGKPLPDWLQFNPTTGKFAGLVPGDLLTGSLPPGGGNTGGHQGGLVPDTLTVEVVARDAKGDIAIIDFTINLKPDKGTHHGWNLPRDFRNIAPAIELPHQHALLAPHHGLAAAPHYAAAHGRDLGSGLGRAGLSQQLAAHGLHGMHADRIALLESLRHATAGHG